MKQRFVLDASVAVAWALDDEKDSYPEKILDILCQREALVPSIWPLEVANALLIAERRKRLTRADVENFLSLIQELPIQIAGDSISRIWGEVLSLAREEGLSVYDATYISLAMRMGLSLATMNQALKKAAQSCGVEIL